MPEGCVSVTDPCILVYMQAGNVQTEQQKSFYKWFSTMIKAGLHSAVGKSYRTGQLSRKEP